MTVYVDACHVQWDTLEGSSHVSMDKANFSFA
jgi:hypothetical protein